MSIITLEQCKWPKGRCVTSLEEYVYLVKHYLTHSKLQAIYNKNIIFILIPSLLRSTIIMLTETSIVIRRKSKGLGQLNPEHLLK